MTATERSPTGSAGAVLDQAQTGETMAGQSGKGPEGPWAGAASPTSAHRVLLGNDLVFAFDAAAGNGRLYGRAGIDPDQVLQQLRGDGLLLSGHDLDLIRRTVWAKAEATATSGATMNPP